MTIDESIDYQYTQYRKDLIAMITPLITDTHNEQDVKDLQTMTIKELKVIYKDLTEQQKVNGYTNNTTYRLCLILDNIEYHKKGIFDYFFDAVKDEEFEESDYEVINWNEVAERYSNKQKSHYFSERL